MAGFYETIMSDLNSMPVQTYTPTKVSVFGGTIAKPTHTSAGVAKLQAAVNTANKAVNKAQNAYDSYMKKAPVKSAEVAQHEALMNSIGYRNPTSANSGRANFYNTILANGNDAYNKYQTQMNNYNTKLGNLNTALKAAQKTLASKKSALSDYKTKMKSETDAVNWGLAAKNAENQGIANAAKMYQQAMQGEAVRNAIMNGAIGTVGNFGGVK